MTVNALHPGLVATDFGKNTGGIISALFGIIAPFVALSPEKGAETSIYLASSPEVEGVSGKYFIKRKEASSSKETYDEAAQQRLWQICAELTKLAQ